MLINLAPRRSASWLSLTSLLTICTLSLTGCYHPDRQKLIGKWHVNLDMSETDVSGMSALQNPLVAVMGQTLMNAVQAGIELDLQQDGTLHTTVSMLGSTFNRTGTWRYVDSKAGNITVSSQFEGAAEPQLWTLRFQGNDAFQTTPPQLNSEWQFNRMVTFRRVEPQHRH